MAWWLNAPGFNLQYHKNKRTTTTTKNKHFYSSILHRLSLQKDTQKAS